MTRINHIHARSIPAFRAQRTGSAAASRGQRLTATRTDRVNDTPIEEVVFDPNSGVDQRARTRGYVIAEPVETELVEKASGATAGPQKPDHFWQQFSAPFMAQVIGQQQSARRTDTARAYAAQPAPAVRQLKAC